MQRQNPNNPLWAKIGLLLLCLLLCSVLILGVTFGRYLQDFSPVTYPFVADGGGTLVLGGTVTQDWLDKGVWPDMATDWTVQADTATLAFSISNGRSAEGATSRSQLATVRLVAGLGIGAPENMTVTLSFSHNGQMRTLTGEAERIQKGSMLYQNYGDGWIYYFYDDLGNEKNFTLSGGKLSYENMTVTLTGDTDPVLCQLQVFGSYIDE